MSYKKRDKRELFNQFCLVRDEYECRVCKATENLEVHHIIDRHEIPNGGYVKENGITLCPSCHIKAEEYHKTNNINFIPNYHPDDLFKLINSSKELAIMVATTDISNL